MNTAAAAKQPASVTRALLEATPLFSAAPQDVLNALCAQARTLTALPKGHVLFMQDDPAEWFYIVASGWVKLYRETLDGDEAVLDIMPVGSICGETAFFENDSYACSAEIAETATIHAYPLSILSRAIRDHNDLAIALLKHINKRNIFQGKEIEHRTVQSASQRIGCYLLRLCKQGAKGAISLHLPHDKAMIAARLGMQPETFSRALARLQKDVGLRVKGYTIELDDLDELISYTCSACSNVFPCEDHE